MKLRSFSLFLTSAIAFGAVATIPRPIEAASNKYFCAVLDGIPKTFVRTEGGNVAMISWQTQTSADWKPLKRCVEVSKRFQRFHDHRTLQYIGTGTVNNQPVLCAVPSQDSGCHDRNVLVTLPPQMNRHQAAQHLLDMRRLARGRNLQLSGGKKLETYINGENYYDLEVLEQVAPTVEASVTPVERY